MKTLQGAARLRGLACALVLMAGIGTAQAETLTFYASASGKQTLDQGEGGGNPFASALIDALSAPSLDLSAFSARLARVTYEKSGGFQSADVPPRAAKQSWTIIPKPRNEKRLALVLVTSDYTRTGGLPSLQGARHDAQRVAQALQRAEFETETVLDLGGREIAGKLADFARRSQAFDVAVIYTTGHGLENRGEVYVLPSDFPARDGDKALVRHAVALRSFAASIRARRVNLLFYGGCRDNPFGR